MIPLTVIGGYLGAGKTTFINKMLTETSGQRIAVLVNDFGDLNIDVDLIADHDGETYELTNGCICCAIGDDLDETLRGITGSANPPDAVVIEASGVAEPDRVATYGGAWNGLELAKTIVVVDVETITQLASDKFVGGLVMRQIAAADSIHLSKLDLVDDQRLAHVTNWLADKTPRSVGA